MNQFLRAAVVAVATTRLTALVTKDEISEPIRMKVDQWARGAEMFSFRERVQYLINCPRCASVWLGGLAMLADQTKIGRGVLAALAASEFAIVFLGRVDNE